MGIAVRATAVVLVMLGLAALPLLHHGDQEASARVANREIASELETGETVVRRVSVMQRQWWDFFRVSHGVLAATDRRLLFVGVPPAPLVAHEDEPPDLEEGAWAYETLLPARRQPTFFRTSAGITLGSAGERTTFMVDPRNGARLDSLIAFMDRRMAAVRSNRVAERKAAEAARAASRAAIYHLVQRGETLDEIAARYGTTTDSLRDLNHLVHDRIRSGQRLLVRPRQ